MSNLILDYITEIPNSIEVLGLIDNNSEKWGGVPWKISIFS